MKRCPPREELERALAETLDPAAQEEIEAHLGDCPTCKEVFQRLIGELAWPLRRPPDTPSLAVQATPSLVFLEKLKKDAPAGAPAPAAAAPQAVAGYERPMNDQPLASTGLPPGSPSIPEPVATNPTQRAIRRIRCPHCHNPLQLADRRSDEVLCPSCGSNFRIQDSQLTTTASGSRRLGKFQALERVGLGAFGAVWKARDTELDRLVALKIPHACLMAKPEDLERFHREARAAAQLRHPGLVAIHEVTILEGLLAIVSDFIGGVVLRDFLQQRRLTFRESAELLAQVAEAMHYAHERGLVHRDIKPGNIILEFSADRDGADTLPRPRVIDFGLALRGEAEIT